jgi:putative peptide zinc metalloprotease protein
MTLQLRPTFSESWYRVKDLKPRLRAAAQISRQWYRGERWYVVRDPAGNQFHRLSDVAYRFVGLLDGTRTVGDAWELVGGQLADDAPTQPEIIQILSQLYAANLIETNISPDAQVLLRRHKKQRQRKFQGRLMNMLFPRIPFWDPDTFLKRWMPLAGPLISKGGMILWLVTVGLALFMVLPRMGDFAQETGDLLQSGTVEMWLALGAVFLLTKFLHEMGHAFTCRRFGGEVHEIGIMFLVLMPCPYVDASTAWGFPSKWKRILVAAGGMIAEIFIAAIATFVWVLTADNANTAIHQIAYYTMLIASVSTLLFNANPLLRYDGYYILSDWLEIPNLQQKSREYTLGLVKRYVFRVKTTQPLPATFRQKAWLVFYNITSSVYRIFIGFAIMLMVLYQLPEPAQIIGLFLAAGAIVTFFVVPIFKLFKYITTDPELHRKRTRAWAFTGMVTAGIIVLLGLIPFPSAVRAQGVAEPLERSYAMVRSPGTVEEILVTAGEYVEKNQVLARLHNDELIAERDKVRHELNEARIMHNAARNMGLSERGVAAERLAQAQQRLDRLERQVKELTIIAPNDGVLVAPDLHRMAGRFLKKGQAIGEVQDDEMLEIFVTFDQGDWDRIADEHADEGLEAVQVRLTGNIDQMLTATKLEGLNIEELRLLPGAKNSVRSGAVTSQGGGTFAPDASEPNQLASDQFEMRVTMLNPLTITPTGQERRFFPGQRAYVRVKLDDEPLALQWWRSFLQLIQTQRTARSIPQQ